MILFLILVLLLFITIILASKSSFIKNFVAISILDMICRNYLGFSLLKYVGQLEEFVGGFLNLMVLVGIATLVIRLVLNKYKEEIKNN